MTVLGSREQMCIHKKVSRSKTKTEDCGALLDTRSCIPGLQAGKLLGNPSIQSGASMEIWDVEDIVKLGARTSACPYYATRKMAETAEVIFCPYNYLIDPSIRQVMNINLKGAIVILDEAHNIEDASRSAGSFEVTEIELSMVYTELNQVIRNKKLPNEHNLLLYFVESLLQWIKDPSNVFTIQEFEQHVFLWSGPDIIAKLKEIGVTKNTFEASLSTAFTQISSHAESVRRDKERKNMVAQQTSSQDPDGGSKGRNRECLSINALRIIGGIFLILSFLYDSENNYENDYRMALIKKVNRGRESSATANWDFKLGFWCLNPGVIFSQLSKTTHSIILTSGTLSPLAIFASELDSTFPIRLEASHVIEDSQVWVRVIPTGPNNVLFKGIYSQIESFSYQDDVGEALCQIAETVPFGVLVFMPSYSTLDKLKKRWMGTKLLKRLENRKKIFFEPNGSDKKIFERSLKGFYDYIKSIESNGPDKQKDGAIYFAVFRGKVSEGIDFKDNNCRTVVTLGIPFPNIKDIQMNLKKAYNDSKWRPGVESFKGSQWYSAQAYRAINQALGRCIRHQKDWGAIILLEERFREREHLNGLSKWVAKSCQVETRGFSAAMNSLSEFMKQRISIEMEREELELLGSASSVPVTGSLTSSSGSSVQTNMFFPNNQKSNPVIINDETTATIVSTVSVTNKGGSNNPIDLSGSGDIDDTSPKIMIPAKRVRETAIKDTVITQDTLIIPNTKTLKTLGLKDDTAVSNDPTTDTKATLLHTVPIRQERLQKQGIIECRWHGRHLFANEGIKYLVEKTETKLDYFLDLEYGFSIMNKVRNNQCKVLKICYPPTWTTKQLQAAIFHPSVPVVLKTSESDGLVYRVFESMCCKKPIGGLICGTTSDLSSSRSLVGNLFILHDCVRVLDGTDYL
ncbi:helicase C-terminal domain-containing protein [Phycomyces nitens]|nr:helicase C-terminal domain-containing protein [Phycomyces nitens]